MKYPCAKELGMRCKNIRRIKKMSMRKLADIVHTTPQNISKLEKNGIHDIDMLNQISNALRVDLLDDKQYVSVFTKKNIFEAISSKYEISEDALMNKKIYKKQRAIMIYLLRKYTYISIAEISREMGIKDYTKILYIAKKFQESISTDRDLEEEVNAIIDDLFQKSNAE